MPVPTFTMQSFSAAYNTVTGQSGSVYHSNATGLVANVLAADVASLQAAGFTIIGPGYGGFRVPLLNAKNSDGSVLAAAASGGKFGFAVTLGTSSNLVSQIANNSTITDTALWELQLPSSFLNGSSPSIIVNCNHVLGSGVLGAHTLALHAYPIADDGTQLADIVTTSGQNTPAAAADLTFATSTAALIANGRVIVTAVANIVETGTSAVSFKVNSLRFA